MPKPEFASNSVPSPARRSWLEHPLWVVLGVYALTALIRILGPSDLPEGDQPKQADYVTDIAINGNWLVQHSRDVDIATKPPLYNWLAAPLIMLNHKPGDFLLKLPSLFAGLAAAFLIWDMARRRFSENVALFAAVFAVVSFLFAKLMYFARTDMLLSFWIVMQFWAITRWEDASAESSSQSSDSREKVGESGANPNRRYSIASPWLWLFWFTAGMGNLTKGPIGLAVVLPALAIFWLWTGNFRRQFQRLGWLWGVPVMLLPFGLWVMAIWFAEGRDAIHEVWNRMAVDEFFSRFQMESAKSAENRPFWYYVPHLMARTAPWSLLAGVALFLLPWRRFGKYVYTSVKPPGKKLADYRGAIFAASWMLATLVLFSPIPSKRVDRIFPLVPALAMLAAWIYDAFLRRTMEPVADANQNETAGVLTLSSRSSRVVSFLLKFSIALLSGLALIAIICPILAETGVLTPENAPKELNPILSYQSKVCMMAGSILAAAVFLTVYCWAFQMARFFTAGLIAAMLMAITLYQHVLCEAALHPEYEYSRLACRRLSQDDIGINARGERIILLAGHPASMRFYLQQTVPAMTVQQAADAVAASKEPVIVVGTFPEFEKDTLVSPNQLGILTKMLSERNVILRDGLPIGTKLPVADKIGFCEFIPMQTQDVTANPRE